MSDDDDEETVILVSVIVLIRWLWGMEAPGVYPFVFCACPLCLFCPLVSQVEFDTNINKKRSCSFEWQ